MIRREIILFEEPGAKNTQTTLEAVKERAKLLGIKKSSWPRAQERLL